MPISNPRLDGDTREVPPAARNLVVNLDCTARGFGVGDSENFRLLDEAIRSVTISWIHTNPNEFVGMTRVGT